MVKELIQVTCPKCFTVIKLTKEEVPRDKTLNDVHAVVCMVCGIDVRVKDGRKAAPRKERSRVVIRAFRSNGGSLWHWMWRCTWYGINTGRCNGGVASTASHREALEGARRHAWLKHGVRL